MSRIKTSYYRITASVPWKCPYCGLSPMIKFKLWHLEKFHPDRREGDKTDE